VGTANFINPRSTLEIIDGIERYLVARQLKDVRELIGSLDVDVP
jgi:dihydroorotate dehydrogenase (NAD+) catalytic subunit